MKLHTLCLLITSSFLAACSANTVNVIAGQDSITPIHESGEREGRYHNLYAGDKTYPVTCEADCYPQHPNVICETTAENCTFNAEQLKPQLNLGFNIRWLGHAGFMIQTPNGQHVVFDPVKEQFDSPVDLAFKLASGFYRQPGDWLTQSELKNLDAIMYSHIHYAVSYTHLTLPTILLV